VANKTVERMLDKVSRLYEQGADDNRVEDYVRRWAFGLEVGWMGCLMGWVCWVSFPASPYPSP